MPSKIPPIRIQSVSQERNAVEINRDLEILGQGIRLISKTVNELVDSVGTITNGPDPISGTSGTFGPLAFYSISQGLVKSASQLGGTVGQTIRYSDSDSNWIADSYLKNYGSASPGGISINDGGSPFTDVAFQVHGTGTSTFPEMARFASAGADDPTSIRVENGSNSIQLYVSDNTSGFGAATHETGVRSFDPTKRFIIGSGSTVLGTYRTLAGFGQDGITFAQTTTGLSITPLGMVHIVPKVNTQAGLYMKLATSQSANAVTIQNSLAADRFTIDQNGGTAITIGAVGTRGLTINGIAAQTADYYQINNSAGVVTQYTSVSGVLHVLGSTPSFATIRGGANYFITSGNTITRFQAWEQSGNTAGTFAVGGAMSFVATENHSASAWGSDFVIAVAANTTAAITNRLRITNAGNILLNDNQSALATNASGPFPYIPSCAGTPTGTPTSFTGNIPLVWDSTNHRLYGYSGSSWRILTGVHNDLTGLTTGDPHTQYALLLGRSGGQTLIGGTASGNNLTLRSSSNATRGKVIFGNAGTTAYDDVNDRLGVGTASPTEKLDVAGNILLTTAGNGLKIKEGTNATMGVATLVAGTVTVNTTKVTANSRIFITNNTPGGTVGFIHVSARTAATSFTITSSDALDTSNIAWIIIEPG